MKTTTGEEAEDLAFVAWMDEAYAQAEIADKLAFEAYEAWQHDRLEDGEDGSEQAYQDYLESMLPTD